MVFIVKERQCITPLMSLPSYHDWPINFLFTQFFARTESLCTNTFIPNFHGYRSMFFAEPSRGLSRVQVSVLVLQQYIRTGFIIVFHLISRYFSGSQSLLKIEESSVGRSLGLLWNRGICTLVFSGTTFLPYRSYISAHYHILSFMCIYSLSES